MAITVHPTNKKKPEDTEKSTTLGSMERGGHRTNHGPEETGKGTQGIQVSWSTDSLAEYTVSPAHWNI